MKNTLHTNNGSALRALATATLLLAIPAAALNAQTYVWQGGDGSFEDDNWAPSAGTGGEFSGTAVITNGTVTAIGFQASYVSGISIGAGGHLRAAEYVELNHASQGLTIDISGGGSLSLAGWSFGFGTGLSVTGGGTINLDASTYLYMQTANFAGSVNLKFDGSDYGYGEGYSSVYGAYLDFEQLTFGIDMYTPSVGVTLDNLEAGTHALIHAVNLVDTGSDFFVAGGNSAAGASLYWGEADDGSGAMVLYADIVTSSVPEPATYAAIAGLALLVYVIVRRRR
ncbi:PEP-CTERM sorting domain-containing protein [Opitutaceae bacterium TAV4]|nr:PEP-CTERM sorting domain-containing protein [Opitutaceae bacterium TAV4]RRK02204.1 PEP-CTERM sorting domain-containing protein [Opitutaceae bacterium TAV3]